MSHLAAVAPPLATVVLPVFALIAVGRLLVRFRFVDAPGTKGLTGVVFWVLLPSLLFLSLVDGRAPPDPAIVATYFGAAVPVFALSVLCGRLALRMRVGEAAVFALNAAYGNTVLLGIPIVGAVWGAPGLATLLSIVAAHSLVLLPAATVLVELDRSRDGARPGRAVLWRAVLEAVGASLRNPIISAIVVAALWRWLGWPVPEVARRCLEPLAQAAPALSLICLGASLPALRPSGVGAPVLLAVAIKLAVLPLCMVLAVRAAAIPPPASAVMILTAAMPTGANAFLLAHRTGAMMAVSATTVVVATALAVVTLTAILAALG